MLLNIENLTDKLVLLRFKSGLTRYLAPNETLEGLEVVEIKGNDKIRRLVERRAIAVLEPPAKGEHQKGEHPEEHRRRSREMRAEDAIEFIRSTPLKELHGFLSPDEERVTVRQAMEEKRRE